MEAIKETPLDEVRNRTSDMSELKEMMVAQLEATATLIENSERDKLTMYEMMATIFETTLEVAAASGTR